MSQLYVKNEFTDIALQRFNALVHEPVFKTILETTYSKTCIDPDDVIHVLCSRLPKMASCSIEKQQVWTSRGYGADSSTTSTTNAHTPVGGMIGVGLDAPREDGLFNTALDDIPDGYSAAETCVPTHMTKATTHPNKDLSSAKNLPDHVVQDRHLHLETSR